MTRHNTLKEIGKYNSAVRQSMEKSEEKALSG